jgi:hypothetical protein
MKNLLLASVFALSLSGCANGIPTVVNDINAVTAALSSPAATQATANLKAGSQAIACAVGDISQLVGNVAVAVGGSGPGNAVLIRDAASVYVASATVCTTLGGSVIAVETVPAGAKPFGG